MTENQPQSREMSDYEQLEFALWFALACRCECCERWDDFSAQLEDGDDPSEWAKVVAPKAEAVGWSAPGHCFLLCPDCRANGVDWRQKYTPPPSGGIRAEQREAFQRLLDAESTATRNNDSRPLFAYSVIQIVAVVFVVAGISMFAYAPFKKLDSEADIAIAMSMAYYGPALAVCGLLILFYRSIWSGLRWIGGKVAGK